MNWYPLKGSVAQTDSSVTRSGGLILAVLGIAFLTLITALAYRSPSPRRDAANEVFSAYRAQAELKSLVGDGIPHPIGSEANARVRNTILARLTALGYDTELQSGFICNPAAVCGTPINIIARLPASAKVGALDDEFVLLSAHYDSVPAGPGAADDAAGVAAVLEIARILTVRASTRHPIAILISDGEEAGLLGAFLFVRDHPLAKRVAAAVNLEARGNSGPSLMFETGSANAWLMSLYRHAISRPITDSVYYVAYKSLPNNTDFSVFKAAEWQGFNFAFIGDVAHYHTALDTFENVDLRSIEHQGDNALASLLALADSEPPQGRPAADAVYFDLFARVLIAWPARLSLPAASGVLVLLLLEIAVFLQRRRVTLAGIGWGILGAAASMLLATGASGGILFLLLKSGKVAPLSQYSWIAHPAWMSLTCAALAAAAAGLCSHWLARRAGFWGFWCGMILILAILAELQAVWIPGMGFVPLLTAAVGSIAVLPTLRAATHTWRADLAALAPAWIMCALLVPLLSLLYGALGSVAWIIDTLLLSLGATLLLPLLAVGGMSLRRRIIGAATAASLFGVMMTVVLPTYSAAWPQRLNFRYRLDANEHRAVWLAEPDSLKLPDYVARATSFKRELRVEEAGTRSHAFQAAATLRELEPPLLTLSSAEAQSNGATRYNLQLQSMRGAPEIEVAFPARAQIHEVIFSDATGERRVPLYEAQNGETRLHVVGQQRQGVNFAVEVRGGPLKAHLFDQSFALVGGEFLARLRPPEATSSQDGDTTIVQNTVTLDPAAGR
jgi:hypothetical protein